MHKELDDIVQPMLSAVRLVTRIENNRVIKMNFRTLTAELRKKFCFGCHSRQLLVTSYCQLSVACYQLSGAVSMYRIRVNI